MPQSSSKSSSKLDYLSKYIVGGNHGADSEDNERPNKKKKKDKKSKQDKKKQNKPDKSSTARLVDLDDDDNYHPNKVIKDKTKKKFDDDEDNDNDNHNIMDINDEDRPTVVSSLEVAADIHKATGALSTPLRPHPRGSWNVVPIGTTTAAEASSASDPPAEQGRRGRHDSESEQEEEEDRRPQQKRRRYDSDDSSSSKHAHSTHTKATRHDSESNTDSDYSNTKNSRHRRKPHDSGDDSSRDPPNSRRPQPQRRRYDSDSDDCSGHDKVLGTKKNSTERSPAPPPKERLTSGHVAGLQHGKQFTKSELELQAQKKKDAQFMVDKYGMGETTYRDDKGRRRDGASSSSKGKQAIIEDPTLNQGKVQRQREQAQREEYHQLSQSTFARHADDDQMEKLRQSEIRKGDPMAAFSGRKKSVGVGGAPQHPQRPSYKGPPPRPHRFGTSVIPPGYRWDAIYRGNGFEDKLLASQFSAKRKQQEAYKWSSADM
jgi:Pre-mRNA-splicing factor of RES complex